MELKDHIAQTIAAVIGQINERLPHDRQLQAAPDAPLFGSGGTLDSLGLVHFIVAVEQAVEEQFQSVVTLADEKAMSLRNSPFRTVGTLTEYIAGLLDGQECHE